jgi:hypothetical protein
MNYLVEPNPIWRSESRTANRGVRPPIDRVGRDLRELCMDARVPIGSQRFPNSLENVDILPKLFLIVRRFESRHAAQALDSICPDSHQGSQRLLALVVTNGHVRFLHGAYAVHQRRRNT